MITVLRAALSGAATGGRTFTGLAVLTATTPPAAQSQPDRTLARPAAAVPIALLAVTELVLDKLPQTPSRLGPPGLIGRLVVAAGCGVIVARRAGARPERPVPPGEPIEDADIPADPKVIAACAATAVVAAAATAWFGTRCRDLAHRTFGADWIGAALEDAVVVTLAAAATR